MLSLVSTERVHCKTEANIEHLTTLFVAIVHRERDLNDSRRGP
jgi:hypothetical protein